MVRSRALGFVGMLVLTAWGGGAAPTDEAEASDEAAVTELKAYWADAKKLDLGDLIRVVAGFATDKLNDAMAVGPVSARFDAPRPRVAHRRQVLRRVRLRAPRRALGGLELPSRRALLDGAGATVGF